MRTVVYSLFFLIALALSASVSHKVMHFIQTDMH